MMKRHTKYCGEHHAKTAINCAYLVPPRRAELWYVELRCYRDRLQ